MTSIDASAAPALPLKSERNSALPSQEDGAGRGRAWQREMERAQMDAWLSHGIVGHTSPPNAGLVLSAVAAATASPTFPSEDDTIAAASSAPPSASPASSSVPPPASMPSANARSARASMDFVHPGDAENVHAGAATQPAEPPSDGPSPVPREHPSLPSTASDRAKEVVASHPKGPPPGLAVAAAAAASRSGASPPATASLSQLSQAGASDAARSNFITAGLSKVLEQFGAVETATGSITAPADSQAIQAPEVEKLHGISRAAQVLAIAAGRNAEAPRGLTVAAGVLAGLSLQPNAPPQRTAGPANRPLKVPQMLEADAAAEPIRVHADWSEDGVRVWLGMNAGALDSLEQITTGVQAWLNAQGLRLRSLSCNGQLLSQEPVPPGASDDPLTSSEPATPSAYAPPKELS
jgi:hypothetical protein